MKTIELRNALPLSLITHDMLAGLLGNELSNDNDKIFKLVNNGDLIRLKKGFYVFAKHYQAHPFDLIAIANGLYAPSYVSFEYALSLYGMIPERVYEITSATYKHNKIFDTPVGRFSYQKIPLNAYALGVDWDYDEVEGGRFIATAEKALCDKIRYDKGIGTLSQKAMLEYLYEDLRIEFLKPLNIEWIRHIAQAYGSRNLRTLATVIEKEQQ